MKETSGRYPFGDDDPYDICNLEMQIHEKFDKIDYENLTGGEHMRLLKALWDLNEVANNVLTGYYKETDKATMDALRCSLKE